MAALRRFHRRAPLRSANLRSAWHWIAAAVAPWRPRRHGRRWHLRQCNERSAQLAGRGAAGDSGTPPEGTGARRVRAHHRARANRMRSARCPHPRQRPEDQRDGAAGRSRSAVRRKPDPFPQPAPSASPGSSPPTISWRTPACRKQRRCRASSPRPRGGPAPEAARACWSSCRRRGRGRAGRTRPRSS